MANKIMTWNNMPTGVNKPGGAENNRCPTLAAAKAAIATGYRFKSASTNTNNQLVHTFEVEKMAYSGSYDYDMSGIGLDGQYYPWSIEFYLATGSQKSVYWNSSSKLGTVSGDIDDGGTIFNFTFDSGGGVLTRDITFYLKSLNGCTINGNSDWNDSTHGEHYVSNNLVFRATGNDWYFKFEVTY